MTVKSEFTAGSYATAGYFTPRFLVGISGNTHNQFSLSVSNRLNRMVTRLMVSLTSKRASLA